MDLDIKATGRINLTFANGYVYTFDQGVGRFRMRTDAKGRSDVVSPTQLVFIDTPEGTAYSFDQRAQKFLYRMVDDIMETLPDGIVVIPTEEGYLDFDQDNHRFLQ